MSRKYKYISIRKALKDYLKEERITLADLLKAMDEDKSGIMEALVKRIRVSEKEVKFLEMRISSKDLNLLLFVIQVFYLLNPSGMYKGFVIEPVREAVLQGEKVSFEGSIRILTSLQISV